MATDILSAQIVPIDVQKMRIVFCDEKVELSADDLGRVTKAYNDKVAMRANKAAAENLLDFATLLTPQFWANPETLFPFRVRVFNPECNAVLSPFLVSSWFCLGVDPTSLEILPGKIHPWLECTTLQEMKSKVHKCVVEDGKIVFECRCVINGTRTTTLEYGYGTDWEKQAPFAEKRDCALFCISLLWSPDNIPNIDRISNLVKKLLAMELQASITEDKRK